MIHFLEITKDNFERFHSPILEIEESSFASPWSLNAFVEEVNRPMSHLWALLVEEVLRAYICFWIVSGEAHLMNIAVHPGGRRNGLGRYLLSRMIEFGESETIQAAWRDRKGIVRKNGFHGDGPQAQVLQGHK
jgi:ribosomal protein S18 acetylase RimI-like enzyme